MSDQFGSREAKRILIIDDEEHCRRAAVEALEGLEGVELVAPDTLEECLRIAFQEKVDIALIDNSLNNPLFQEPPWSEEEYGGMRGCQIVNRLARENSGVIRLGFSNSSITMMDTDVTGWFERKFELESKVTDIRVEAQQRLREFVVGMSINSL
jgi:CheY-like chemotaxis protein